MPANNKYLTKSFSQKLGKVSCAILGGYLISALLHMNISLWFSFHKETLVIATISVFFFWVVFMLIAFLFKNAWSVWLLYGIVIVVLVFLYLVYPYNNPFL